MYSQDFIYESGTPLTTSLSKKFMNKFSLPEKKFVNS